MNRKFVIIGNPVAGGGAREKIARALSILKSSGIDAELRFTSRKGDAESFARQASEQSGVVVIAAGGDGTYNEVANGLVRSETPLAILPMGTTSVLARELNIPLDIDKALEIAMQGRTQAVHLGKITLMTSSGEANKRSDDVTGASRYFILMAGIGYDADAVYGVNETIKKYSGRLAYILSGARVIMRYHPERLTINANILNADDIMGGRFRLHPEHFGREGDSLLTTGYTVIVSKAACYGGDLKIAPDADLKSPYLYVFVTHNRRRLDLVRHLSAIISGRTLDLKDISYFRTDNIRINGSSRIQIDGDYAGTAPAGIQVARNALKLVMPR